MLIIYDINSTDKKGGLVILIKLIIYIKHKKSTDYIQYII